MSHERADPQTAGPRSELFDLEAVAELLRDTVSWPWREPPCDVVLERCWPARGGGFVFEWSFGVAGLGRRRLFGMTGDGAASETTADDREAREAAGDIRGVRVRVPEWGLLLHSPDRDPVLPQLSVCLDDNEMARRLSEVWGRRNGGPRGPADSVDCRLLGYRPGRRAAIGYQPAAASAALVGKTYADDRGRRATTLHAEVNEQIAWHSDRRVRVPAVIDYLPDLRLSLCGHSRGRVMSNGAGCSPEDVGRAAEALAALHLSHVDGLRRFSIAHECQVVRRWQSVLGRIHPRLAEMTGAILDALLRLSTCVDDAPQCTVHRDFYEGQLLMGRRTTTILDLDTLAVSHPCVDLGNLLAHLYLDRLVRGRSRGEFDALASALLSHYEARVGGVDRRALGFYCSSSLFRVGAVHAVRTRTGRYSPAMWEFAEEVLLNVYRQPGIRPVRFLRPRHGVLRSGNGALPHAVCLQPNPIAAGLEHS